MSSFLKSLNLQIQRAFMPSKNNLTLYHGQAAQERGFNHNNYVLQPDMTPNAITSKWLIKGHMLAYGLEPHTIEITKPINV